MHKTMAILLKVNRNWYNHQLRDYKQAGNNVNPTWPFYFEEIFCVSLVIIVIMLLAITDSTRS